MTWGSHVMCDPHGAKLDQRQPYIRVTVILAVVPSSITSPLPLNLPDDGQNSLAATSVAVFLPSTGSSPVIAPPASRVATPVMLSVAVPYSPSLQNPGTVSLKRNLLSKRFMPVMFGRAPVKLS